MTEEQLDFNLRTVRILLKQAQDGWRSHEYWHACFKGHVEWLLVEIERLRTEKRAGVATFVAKQSSKSIVMNERVLDADGVTIHQGTDPVFGNPTSFPDRT